MHDTAFAKGENVRVHPSFGNHAVACVYSGSFDCCRCVETLSGQVLAWTERGNSVLQKLTCSQLAHSVRNQQVRVQQPLDVTGTWISTR